MIQAINQPPVQTYQKVPGQVVFSLAANEFVDEMGSAKAAQTVVSAKAVQTSADATQTSGSSQATLGEPDVQGWLDSYYAEYAGVSPSDSKGPANVSYQAAPGASSNYSPNDLYSPDAIFQQALANQAGNAYAQMTGQDPAKFTSQLPGVPTAQSQAEFDRRLALSNAERLQAGEPIDTSAYWNDPGPVTIGNTTYTSQQLGYAGPGQSSGPEPIWISVANQVGPGEYSVPFYQGTVKGIQPGHFYTLQQLQAAGLPSGQPDGQFHPGSWSEVQSA